MAEHTIPNSLHEKYMQERSELYALLWKIDEGIANLISGNVASYSLGNRSLTYNDIDKMKKLKEDTEARIESLEAKLSHRSPRAVTVNTYLDPSIIVPRR